MPSSLTGKMASGLLGNKIFLTVRLRNIPSFLLDKKCGGVLYMDFALISARDCVEKIGSNNITTRSSFEAEPQIHKIVTAVAYRNFLRVIVSSVTQKLYYT